MRKIILAVAIIVFFLVWFILVARLLVGGGEDTWICDEGKWVMHGRPRAPMPEKECLE